MNFRRSLVALAALAALAGCNKDKDVEPPAELVDIEATLAVQKIWSEGIGGGGEKLRLTLGVAGEGETVYVASRDGEVLALDAASGRAQWKTKTGFDLSSGPGMGLGLVVVGSSDGDVVALDAASGKQRWKVRVPGELLSPALVDRDQVIMRTAEGRLIALSSVDGKQRWAVDDLVPRLSLRGTSTPVAAGEAVISGFDSGKVMSVTRDTGEIIWQAQISTARGRTELERLADVDSAVRVSGNDVYAVGYQGRVAMLALDTGQLWWARDLSSYSGMSVDDSQLYIANSDGEVVALRRRDGGTVWQQTGLRRRALGTPVVHAGAIVVGDFDGYLHWMDRESGRFVARERPGSARIAAAPVVVGDRLFVMDEGGKVVAYAGGGAAGR